MTKKNNFAVGVMSGTSLDGIDTVIVQLTDDSKYIKTIGEKFTPFSAGFKNHLKSLCENQLIDKENLVRTDRLLGTLIGETINSLLKENSFEKENISVIGSHGLTVGHFPEKKKLFDRDTSFTIQIGDGDVISSITGIPVVSDFRQKDMAENGEGAPLIPIIDKMLFQNKEKNICCLNIGGISNITLVPADSKKDIVAFDTGPGNCLSDLSISIFHHENLNYDPEGQYAKKGEIDKALLEKIIKDKYFNIEPPKSTGKEHFGNDYLNFIIENSREIEFKNVFTTISYLTPLTISNAINDFIQFEIQPEIIIVSGGGSKNLFFMENLKKLLPKTIVEISDNYNISSDFKEAIGFAMLGLMRLKEIKGSITSVTGCNSEKVLGKLSIPN